MAIDSLLREQMCAALLLTNKEVLLREELYRGTWKWFISVELKHLQSHDVVLAFQVGDSPVGVALEWDVAGGIAIEVELPEGCLVDPLVELCAQIFADSDRLTAGFTTEWDEDSKNFVALWRVEEDLDKDSEAYRTRETKVREAVEYWAKFPSEIAKLPCIAVPESSMGNVPEILPVPPRFLALTEFQNWFKNCGETIVDPLPLSVPYRQIHSWDEAKHFLLADAWEIINEDEPNRLSQFLNDHHKRHFSDRWNLLAGAGTEFIEKELHKNILMSLLRFTSMSTNMGAAIWNDIRRTLRMAYIEQGFMDLDPAPPSPFFTPLLEVFALGHYPCGWENRQPGGNLVIW